MTFGSAPAATRRLISPTSLFSAAWCRGDRQAARSPAASSGARRRSFFMDRVSKRASSEGAGRALEELAVGRLAHPLAVLDERVAAREHVADRALDGHALVRVVVRG